MATTLLQPPTPRAADGTPTRPYAGRLLLAGAAAAVRAAGLGLLPFAVLVLLGWATAAHGEADTATALRTALRLWLLAHGVPLQLEGAAVALVPLGASALPALALVTAARRAARASSGLRPVGARAATLLLTGMGCAYAALVTLAAVLAPVPFASPPAGRACAGGLLFAALFGAVGVRRSVPRVPPVPLADPPPGRVPAWRAVGVAGLGAAGVLLAGGSLLVATSLAVHAGESARLARDLGAGPMGATLLLLLGIALVPNASVYGAAFAVGPGFAVGAGTGVSLAGVSLGALPALPLLAALPAVGSTPRAALPALLAPVAAGLVAGGVLVRRARPATPRAGCLLGLGAGAVAGAVLAVLCALAGGSLGPGRMAVVGPSSWLVGVATAVEVGAVAALLAALVGRRERQRSLAR